MIPALQELVMVSESRYSDPASICLKYSGRHTSHMVQFVRTAETLLKRYSPLNCSGLDPSFSQQTLGLEGSHWEALGGLLSGLVDLGPPGNVGMEDSPLSLGSALEASPSATKPESYTLSKDLIIAASAVCVCVSMFAIW